MQRREVINKIRWIHSQVPDDLEAWMFPPPGAKDIEPGNAIQNIHDVSRFVEVLSRDATAVQILRAFHLSALLDRKEFFGWVDRLFSVETAHKMRDDSDKKEMVPEDSVAIAWRTMIGSVDPIENLTTPEEMRTPELPETFISFELSSIAAENTPLPRLAKATAFAEEAYETVWRAYQIKGSGTLAVVKVESGSSIRIDCKGLGEPIKHLKDLILEAWHKLRHKRAEEVLVNNEVVLGSLAAFEQINMGRLTPATTSIRPWSSTEIARFDGVPTRIRCGNRSILQRLCRR